MATHKAKANTTHKAAPPQPKQTYEGQVVVSVRDAINGDPGFNGTDGHQAVIKLEDGTEKTVLRSDID